MALSTDQYGYLIDPLVPITDENGTTIKDGFIRVYIAGSSTPVFTYRNFDGAVNEKTIELDNSGRCKYPVIVNKSLAYKVVVYDAQHSQETPIITIDKMFAIGASVTAGAGATVVTGLDGLTTKPDGFVDASVIGTDGYVALDHTLVDDELDTDAKVTAVEEDRYIPLLNEDVNDPDSKIKLKRLKQWVHSDIFEEVNDLTEASDFNADDELLVVSPNSTRKMLWTTLANKVLGFIKSLSTTITAFRTGDVIPVDGPSGTAKMSKDNLLQLTAENALAGNVAPAFDPTRTSDNPYLTGEIVIYQGKLRIFKQPHYGAWNASHVAMSGRDLINAYKIYMESLENGALNYDREFSFPFVNATLKSFPLDAVIGVGCEITMALSGDFYGKVTLGALADNQASPYTNIIGFKTTGTTTTATATFLTHSIAFWMSDGHTGGTVTAKLSIRPKKIDLSYLEDAVSDLENLNLITGRLSSTTSKTHTYQSDTLLTYDGFDIGPGNILRVKNSGEFTGNLFIGYFDESNVRHNNIIITHGQTPGEYEFTETSHKLVVWVDGGSGDVGKDAVITFDVISNVTGEVINEIKRKVNTEFTRNKFKNFSIIGDSYSTYYGWIPSGNTTWYAVDGIDGNNSQTNDVDAVEDTWWHKLSKALKIGLIRNESWSGSSISYTNYGSVQISRSFVARAEHLDQNNVLLSKPELIIIMGGTNDAWSSAVCGDPMYSGWTDEDLKKFAPALCKLINDLIKWNPQATILNVVNTGFPADYNSAIETITEHYGILNLFLSFSSSDKQNGHPNKSGMTKICNQIIEKLNAS